ncbi:hypothetical protein VCHENC03_0451 [Vibrio sp. HENC-03]|nr:hypothetical protein VCHENC03_0451 [Vibrio sp. HENC-03]
MSFWSLLTALPCWLSDTASCCAGAFFDSVVLVALESVRAGARLVVVII